MKFKELGEARIRLHKMKKRLRQRPHILIRAAIKEKKGMNDEMNV